MRRLGSEERLELGRVAARRFEGGETWRAIGRDLGWDPTTVRRAAELVGVQPRRWGATPVADADVVVALRDEGLSIRGIAEQLGCSQTAVRTALETQRGRPETRYPRLAQRRSPTAAELHHVRELYDACPELRRPGWRLVSGPEGRQLAESCRALIDGGVPMQSLSEHLDRGAGWVRWLLARHDMLPDLRAARSTRRRTLPDP